MFFGERRKFADQVVAHVEIDLAGGEQQAVVLLRAAGKNGHVEAVAGVGSVGERLIEAAMLGLGQPVRGEDQFVERPRRQAERHESENGAGQRGHADHGNLLASSIFAAPQRERKAFRGAPAQPPLPSPCPALAHLRRRS